MSSFICSAKHFNSIEEKLFAFIDRSDFYLPYSLKDIMPMWHNGSINRDACRKEVSDFIYSLRELNVLCVSLQYKHHYEGCLDEEIETQKEIVKTKTPTQALTDLGVYNALRCVDYQIEIEHLEDLRELTLCEQYAMKILKELINTIAKYIVSNLPANEYERWSIG